MNRASRVTKADRVRVGWSLLVGALAGGATALALPRTIDPGWAVVIGAVVALGVALAIYAWARSRRSSTNTLTLGGLSVALAAIWVMSLIAPLPASSGPTPNSSAPSRAVISSGSFNEFASTTDLGSASVIRGGGLETFFWYKPVDVPYFYVGDAEPQYSATFGFRTYLSFDPPERLPDAVQVTRAVLHVDCRVNGDPAVFGPMNVSQAEWIGSEPDWNASVTGGWATTVDPVDSCNNPGFFEVDVSSTWVNRAIASRQPVQLMLAFSPQFENETETIGENGKTDQIQITELPVLKVTYASAT